jgi:hypothetical protein
MKLASSYTTSKFRFTEKNSHNKHPFNPIELLALLLLSLKDFSSATQRDCTALSLPKWREIAQGLSLLVAFWI